MQMERFLRDNSSNGRSSRTLIVNTLRQGRGQSGTTFELLGDFDLWRAAIFLPYLIPADPSRYYEETAKPWLKPDRSPTNHRPKLSATACQSGTECQNRIYLYSAPPATRRLSYLFTLLSIRRSIPSSTLSRAPRRGCNCSSPTSLQVASLPLSSTFTARCGTGKSAPPPSGRSRRTNSTLSSRTVAWSATVFPSRSRQSSDVFSTKKFSLASHPETSTR